MSDRDSREFWKDVVRLTDASDRECIRSLRIALFILLRDSANTTLRRQIWRLLQSSRSLLSIHKVPVPAAKKGRLLFCFAHGTPSNMQNLLPVAREALRRDLIGGIVSAADFSEELTEFRGRVSIMTVRDLISQLGIGKRLEIAVEAMRTFREVYDIFCLYDARLAARFHRNAGKVVEYAITSLQMSEAFQILLDIWSPSCVVSTSDLWPMEYQLMYQASRRRIPSMVVQHGSLIYYYWPFAASLLAVWGQESFEEMVILGAPPDRLVVVGMPASDGLFLRASGIEMERHTGTDHPVCLILSHTHGRNLEPELFASYKPFLSKMILATPSVQWMVKLHPSENSSFYDDLEPEIRSKLDFLPPTTSLEEALRKADVVTTLYSTAGLEAMIVGLPVIVPIVSPRMTKPGLLPQVKGALLVHTPDEFRRELETLTSDSEYRAQILASQRLSLTHSFSNQGHASEAVVDLLQRCLKTDAVHSTTQLV